MSNKVTDLPFFLERRITINSDCLPMFAPITYKEGTADKASNGLTPLMTNTNHNTVRKYVLVDMQNNFIGNPYNVDNTHRPSTGNDQMILLLGVQVRLPCPECNECCLYICTSIVTMLVIISIIASQPSALLLLNT